MAKRLTDYKP